MGIELSKFDRHIRKPGVQNLCTRPSYIYLLLPSSPTSSNIARVEGLQQTYS